MKKFDITIPFEKLKGYYYDICNWIRHMNGKHMRLIWEATTASPWDEYYMYNVQLAQLEYIHDYMQNGNTAMPYVYQNKIRYLKLAIRLNRIAADCDDTLYDINGDVKFIPVENNPKCSLVDMSECDYQCNVHVNMKNLKRYVPNENKHKTYISHPHELYILKARYLYFKIMNEQSSTWWD